MTQEQSQQELAENQGDQKLNSEGATSHEQESEKEVDYKALYEEEKEQRSKLEDEKKQSRELELTQKTSAQHIDSYRKRRARQREKELQDTRLPTAVHYTDEQINEMTPAQLVRLQQQQSQQVMTAVTRKIGLVEEGRKEEKYDEQIVSLDKDFPDWKRYQDVMAAYADDNPTLSPRQLLGIAAQEAGDIEIVDKLLGRKPKKDEEKKVDEEKKKEKSAKAGVSQKPSMAATDTVKIPEKKMTAREAAAEALRELKGG